VIASESDPGKQTVVKMAVASRPSRQFSQRSFLSGAITRQISTRVPARAAEQLLTIERVPAHLSQGANRSRPATEHRSPRRPQPVLPFPLRARDQTPSPLNSPRVRVSPIYLGQQRLTRRVNRRCPLIALKEALDTVLDHAVLVGIFKVSV